MIVDADECLCAFNADVVRAHAVAAVARVSAAELRLEEMSASLLALKGIFGGDAEDDYFVNSHLHQTLEGVYVTALH